MSNEAQIVIDYDDFHQNPKVDCLDSLFKLRDFDSRIKITLFAVALFEGVQIGLNANWSAKVRDLIDSDTIGLAVHGLYHTQEEFKSLTKREAKEKILQAEEILNRHSFKPIKVFKGPNWGINQATYEALAELDYTHVFTHPTMTYISHPSIKNVVYTDNLKDKLVLKDTMIIHGHTWNVCDNGIEQTLNKLREFLQGQKNVIYKFGNEI